MCNDGHFHSNIVSTLSFKWQCSVEPFDVRHGAGNEFPLIFIKFSVFDVDLAEQLNGRIEISRTEDTAGHRAQWTNNEIIEVTEKKWINLNEWTN